MPITNIVIQITSYCIYFLATFSTKPIPVVPAKNSAATNVPQHIPTATLTPVKISGKEFGKITNLNISSFELIKLKYLPRTSNNKISYNELKKIDARL